MYIRFFAFVRFFLQIIFVFTVGSAFFVKEKEVKKLSHA